MNTNHSQQLKQHARVARTFAPKQPNGTNARIRPITNKKTKVDSKE